MMNPAVLMRIANDWKIFADNHPKFPAFLQAVLNKKAVGTGSIVEIQITSPEGEKYMTNVRITESDMQMFEDIKQIMMQGR